MSDNQPRTKEGAVNKEIILKELRKGKLTFGEILKDTRLPRGTVGRHLKKMLNNEEIFLIWDKKRERKVYTANRKFIINNLLLPELMRYVGANLVARMFYKMTKGEKELRLVWDFQPERNGLKAQPLYRTYDLDRIYKTHIEDKYYTQERERKITPQEVLEEIRSNPEIMNYVRSIISKEDEDSWLTYEEEDAQ